MRLRNMPHDRLSADMSDDEFYATLDEIERKRDAAHRVERKVVARDRLMLGLAVVFLLGQLVAATLRFLG